MSTIRIGTPSCNNNDRILLSVKDYTVDDFTVDMFHCHDIEFGNKSIGIEVQTNPDDIGISNTGGFLAGIRPITKVLSENNGYMYKVYTSLNPQQLFVHSGTISLNDETFKPQIGDVLCFIKYSSNSSTVTIKGPLYMVSDDKWASVTSHK